MSSRSRLLLLAAGAVIVVCTCLGVGLGGAAIVLPRAGPVGLVSTADPAGSTTPPPSPPAAGAALSTSTAVPDAETPTTSPAEPTNTAAAAPTATSAVAPAPAATTAAAAPTRIATILATVGLPALGSAPCLPGQIKGNRASMIYHVPGQQDYARTVQNVMCFTTEAQAQAAGYRRAQR